MKGKLLNGMTVLVVDRHFEGRSILRDQMTKMGAESIRTASGVHAALELMLNDAPDLVVSDWSDDVNGLRLKKVLAASADPRLRDVPVVLIPAHPTAVAMQAAKNARVDGILIRPYSLDSMADRLRKVLARTVRAVAA